MDESGLVIVIDSDGEDGTEPTPMSTPPSQPVAANVRPVTQLSRRHNYYENTYENSEYMPESVRRRM